MQTGNVLKPDWKLPTATNQNTTLRLPCRATSLISQYTQPTGSSANLLSQVVDNLKNLIKIPQ
jgi:hypothetical protein